MWPRGSITVLLWGIKTAGLLGLTGCQITPSSVGFLSQGDTVDRPGHLMFSSHFCICTHKHMYPHTCGWHTHTYTTDTYKSIFKEVLSLGKRLVSLELYWRPLRMRTLNLIRSHKQHLSKDSCIKLYGKWGHCGILFLPLRLRRFLFLRYETIAISLSQMDLPSSISFRQQIRIPSVALLVFN